MKSNTEGRPEEWDGEGELPDIPDAGPDAQPLFSEAPDISTGSLTADAAQVAGTFGDPRTLYEQALDVFEDDREPAAPPVDADAPLEDERADADQSSSEHR